MRRVLSCLRRWIRDSDRDVDPNSIHDETLQSFLEELENLRRKTSIGLLDDGTLLFLVRLEPNVAYLSGRSYDDGCSIHWSNDDRRYWVLRDREKCYGFELPEEIYRHWETNTSRKYRDALRIKDDYFSNITLFHGRDAEGEPVQFLELSESFMEEAGRNLPDV